jgi:hypothetical protein
MRGDATRHAGELVGQGAEPLGADLQLDRQIDRRARMPATISMSASDSTVRMKRRRSASATASASSGEPA